MNVTLNVPSVVMLISGAILVLIVFLTVRGKNDKNALNFKWMLLSAAFWSITNGIELASNDMPFKVLMSQLSYIGICCVMPLWFRFVSGYVKKANTLKRVGTLFLYGIPPIMLALVFTNKWHGLVWPTLTPYSVDGGIRLIYGHGPAVYANAAYSAIVMIMGTVLLISFLLDVSARLRLQVVLVLIASLSPWIANIIYLAGLSPIPAVDLTPIGFIVTGLVFHFAITKFHMLDLMPVARHALFDELTDGVMVLDNKFNIIDVNSATGDLLHQAGKSLVGLPLKHALPELYEIMKKTTEDSKIRNESFVIGDRVIDARISTLMEGKLLRGHLAVIRDVTDARRAQVELMLAKDEAEAASIAKGRFLANVSHEIRTPMNGIVGFLELMDGTGLTGEQKSYLREARSAADSLLVLLNDILDYSRAESGKLELERIPFDLHRAVGEAVSLFLPAAHKKHTVMTHSISEEVPLWIRSDPVKLRQVMNNLIGNAVKFTENGKITVLVHAKEKAGGLLELVLEINDTGIGISEQTRQKLFQAFAQADASTTRKYGGTGLGLAISRKIADLLGGTIEVESELGRGSCFRVAFPVERAEPAAVPENPAAEVRDDAGFIEKAAPTILLVEDIESNRMLATLLLQKMGCSVEFAGNGEIAVESCKSKEYDIILMDCQMPVMDGYEATRTIRAGGGKNTHTAIVAMTANNLESDRTACLEAGMDDFISKPIRRQKLVESIAGQLRRKA